MKKKNLDKIDKDLLDRYIDEETLLAVKFEELDDGWQVSSTEKINAITELRLPIYYGALLPRHGLRLGGRCGGVPAGRDPLRTGCHQALPL